MAILNIYPYILAVFGAERLEDATGFKVYGSAFCVGGNLFMTAGHCIVNAKTHPVWGVGRLNTSSLQWFAHPATDSEIHDTLDIGLIQAEVADVSTFPWVLEEMPGLMDVKTAGYTDGFDPKSSILNIKSFKGYVLAGQPLYDHPGSPRGYELSFVVPMGLSGAPTLEDRNDLKVRGVIIGQRRTEMTLDVDEEIIQENGREVTIKKKEFLHFGIALQSGTMSTAQFRLCGGSVKSYLERNDLLGISADSVPPRPVTG